MATDQWQTPASWGRAYPVTLKYQRSCQPYKELKSCLAVKMIKSVPLEMMGDVPTYLSPFFVSLRCCLHKPCDGGMVGCCSSDGGLAGSASSGTLEGGLIEN